MNKFHELLAPAGNYEKAEYALDFGADAIYIGPKSYSLRARSSNFDIDEIRSITEYAHSLNKKVYVVLNILCHNIHIKNFEEYFKKISECNVDGIICADPFIIRTIKRINSNMELHISTQQSISNSKSALFWKRNGASRVVLAREVSYNNLKLIAKNLKDLIEIEYFIHGAVCISYSGRCTMSNNFSYRDANIGGCAHSCRWLYNVENDNIDYKFTMSAKDMALMSELEKLLELPIASFKVEGRMKSIYYIATIVSSYKKAIDEYKKTGSISYKWIEEIKKAENRETSTACFYDRGKDNMLYVDEEKKVKQVFAFVIDSIDKDIYTVVCKNYFDKSMLFETISYKHDTIKFKIKEILNDDNNEVEVANVPMKRYKIKINSKENLAIKDLVRIIS